MPIYNLWLLWYSICIQSAWPSPRVLSIGWQQWNEYSNLMEVGPQTIEKPCDRHSHYITCIVFHDWIMINSTWRLLISIFFPAVQKWTARYSVILGYSSLRLHCTQNNFPINWDILILPYFWMTDPILLDTSRVYSRLFCQGLICKEVWSSMIMDRICPLQTSFK